MYTIIIEYFDSRNNLQRYVVPDVDISEIPDTITNAREVMEDRVLNYTFNQAYVIPEERS